MSTVEVITTNPKAKNGKSAKRRERRKRAAARRAQTGVVVANTNPREMVVVQPQAQRQSIRGRRSQQSAGRQGGTVRLNAADIERAMVARIVQSIVLPLNAPPVRVSTPYSTEDTSVANPWCRLVTSWDTTAARAKAPVRNISKLSDNNNATPSSPINMYAKMRKLQVSTRERGSMELVSKATSSRHKPLPLKLRQGLRDASLAIPPTDCAAFIMRQTCLAMLVWEANASGKSYMYDILANDPDNGTATAVIPVVDTSTGPIDLAYAQCTTSYAPHGTRLYCGSFAGRTFVYVQAGSTVELRIVGFASGNQFNVDIDMYYDGAIFERQDVAPLTFVAPGYDFTPVFSAYYGFSYAGGTGVTSPVSLTITLNGGEGLWCHHCIKGYETKDVVVQDVRVIAASGMYTNTASVQNLQGEIVGVQLPQGTNWMDYAAADINTLEATSKAVQLPAITGIYGYLKPTQSEDFDFQSPVETYNETLVQGTFDLRFPASYLAIRGRCNDEAGREGYWSFAHGIEFMSTDVWYGVNAPAESSELYAAALDEVKRLPQWKENPTHIEAAIEWAKNAARKVVGAVTTLGPTVLKVAELVAPLLA